MMIHAIFEDGVFRPLQPVDLPESCEVVFEPRVEGEKPTHAKKPSSEGRGSRQSSFPGLLGYHGNGKSTSSERDGEKYVLNNSNPEADREIYEILSRRYNSGDPYGAERHNEHQP